ncbi:MAG: N-acetyl-1-D-myo-inositol-2-amino-2-deoxy-alpha-D-glucopyranoside deacetylase [Actinobacteria bacterium]|nr:N-acetyl-1-D-myo-inositol-2-amino-2-deoxy-alpha-D-glucopyranoside deacetylase [Actinomycetota bacterium]MSW62771.1 N-acetyl-1-D-myo-inositol-2-amino-2-deoxy-alpha-D-glucopyranoside deacetylase [Actinomycetota bacterium]MSX89859.1 N-acetyl-1-D-myo-inositol-2-amino-2-deoxy-alpha-D-glucopyranoside deacetylase [Actinomycetota bacterium]MSZ63485.1 N-acetyl-1-D-myo-inositol-2-amino-2-deoxy-alpha-D-glucopyranoside deacetylase [Actinomycetota bacterium]MTA58264.1 N-acetyl-1-D-myo-inositol-2-amino-2-
MKESYKDYRILLVHAHPDDETINNGATMALYAARGAQITLVTCTRGEEGEVLVAGLSHLASSQEDGLGAHREIELKNAMIALGVSDHRFLGNFRDSGMMGSESNNRPDVFWQADLDSAAALLVKVIDEVKPHIMITYDEIGGYGHPDHIKAHLVAMRASELSSWSIQKIYWNTMPKSVIAAGIKAMKEVGSDFFGTDNVDDIPFAKDDSFVTTLIDGNEYVDAKMAAMRAHETQIALDGPFFALSNNLGLQIWGHEYYTLVTGEKAPPFDGDGRESDLTSGISL